MTIYEFLEMMNDNYDTVFTLFDCNAEELVSVDADEAGIVIELSRSDLWYSNYADCEICSMDMWVEEDGRIHIEFNVEIEADEYDEEEF